MAAEMAEQPAVLRALAARRHEILPLLRALVPAPLAGITLVARGSSDHAAIYGRYLLEMVARRPATLAAPSIATMYDSHVDHTGYLAIAISQSGQTPEIVSVLRRLREDGARSVAVVNAAASPLAAAAEAVIDVAAGEERAVPATKSFTATLLALALVAEALGPVPWEPSDLDGIPHTVDAILADDSAEDVARRMSAADQVIVAGRGLLLAAALETALKIRETSGIFAEGYSGADLRHGPIAAVNDRVPVLVFHSDNDESPTLIAQLCERGASVATVGTSATDDLRLPVSVPAALLPLLAAVRGQQIAAAVARLRGVDADRPSGLSKVTLTH